MSIFFTKNKRKRLHKSRVQFPQDLLGTPTWPSWRHVKTITSVLCNDSYGQSGKEQLKRFQSSRQESQTRLDALTTKLQELLESSKQPSLRHFTYWPIQCHSIIPSNSVLFLWPVLQKARVRVDNRDLAFYSCLQILEDIFFISSILPNKQHCAQDTWNRGPVSRKTRSFSGAFWAT